ncbi:MAG: hypothetical protein HUU26_12180 [Gemmatimonadaceae bacterium]|nr:hypothetical protein [Gemmatimonadaceae bacterium]
MSLAVLSAGCGSLGPSDDPGRRQLADQRQQWATAGIATYEYVVRNTCFCTLSGQDVRVTVVSGVVTARTVVETGEPVPAASTSSYRTIPALFDVIQDAFDRDAADVQVQYDFDYGFPAFVYIDYDPGKADEHFGWTVVSFTPGT